MATQVHGQPSNLKSRFDNKLSSHEVIVQRLTSLLLNKKHYLTWSRAVTIALGGRSKLGKIDGKTKPPLSTDPTYLDWSASDHSVMTWLFNSMEPQIYEIFAFSDTALELWTSLSEMYGQANNASQIFELQQEIAQIVMTSSSP
ncbi:UBN2_3 domain-containing protein [Cephalotus follicularis]|uniref:UBN2_3 domain-containing protein n=1 Tax=Cephalotus follicularis TaxID=3775 RepID=A0A1Q3CJN1_CEPFO|nr:UBN2_3 domain-containing protein [Cephalotus follicularis]